VSFDEVAHAGAEHLDPDAVARYDAKARFDPGEDIEVLRAYGVGAESAIVDIGAGTGVFAVAAAQIVGRVVAVDVSEAMVDAIRARAAEAGAGNVTAVQAGFLSYRHDGGQVDAVYTRNALHHLPDFWKAVALSRMAGLLVDGGLLRLRDLVFSFPPDDAEAGVAGWIDAQATASTDEGWTREELVAHVRDEYSTFTWLLEPLLERAGFEILDAAHAPVGAYAAYTCVKL
jgi:ubiquinone/menaquinone biosynthesis C-methylase UbiE